MNKRLFAIISYIFLFILFIATYACIIIPRYLKYENIYLSIGLLILSFLIILLFGFRKEIKSKRNKTVMKLVVIEFIVYYAILYIFGFFIGFSENPLSFTFDNLMNYFLLPCFIIICSEFIRYELIHAYKNNIMIIIIITMLMICLELLTSIKLYTFESIYKILFFIILSLIPTTIKHMVLSYLSYKSGMKVCVVYRILVELYIIVMPIFTNLGNYLLSITSILFPFVVYMSISDLFVENSDNKKYKRFYITDIIIGITTVALFLLVTGITGYKIVSIASISMEPAIKKGDAVIIKKVQEKDDLKVGDIVSYKENNTIIVHRVEKIKDNYLVTKGDANNTVDDKKIKREDIEGKVIYVIPYIGYPSVLISGER